MNPLKVIASGLFGIVLWIRHKMFDTNMIKSTSFDVPILCVGNIKVGGTGKTPMTDFLIRNLKTKFNIAVLSRGYKRKSKGFILASENSTVEQIGDEPMLLHLRHPDVTLAVCEKRVDGVNNLLKKDPSINLIILDDAFQHRHINTSLDILLTEYNLPYNRDYLLPMGRLRDLRSQAERASFIVITKCPTNVRPIDMRIMMHELKLKPYQSVYFTQMKEGKLFNLFNIDSDSKTKKISKKDPVVIATAIANPKYLLESINNDYNITSKHHFKDHHNYKQSDVDNIIASARKNNAYIIITEKDAVKIKSLNIPCEDKFRFYVAPIDVVFVDSDNSGNSNLFTKNLIKSITSKDGKYCLQNKQFNK